MTTDDYVPGGGWPALPPAPGAPLSSRSRAHLELAEALRTVADFARDMVPTGRRPSPAYAGTLLADALALHELTAGIVEVAAIVERADGSSWAELADAAGTDEREARTRWRSVELEWQARSASPGTAAAAQTAAEIDDWLARHHTPASVAAAVPGARFRDVLDRMGPLDELLDLAITMRTADHAELPALLDRQALVHDLLAAHPLYGSDGEHQAAAARCRAAAAAHETP